MPDLTIAWLVGVARHKLVDHWRRQAREERQLRLLEAADAGRRGPVGRQLDVGSGPRRARPARAAPPRRAHPALPRRPVRARGGRAARPHRARHRGAARAGPRWRSAAPTKRGTTMAADPLDALREPVVPARPPARVRRRPAPPHRAALGRTPPGGTMTVHRDTADRHDPPPHDHALPHRTKGAARGHRVLPPGLRRRRDVPDGGRHGRIGHAELDIDGIVVMLADEHPEIGIVSPETLGGDRPGAHPARGRRRRHLRAGPRRRGRRGERPPADQFYGERSATLRSTRSAIAGRSATRSKQVSIEELAAAPRTTPSPRGQPDERRAVASSATSRCRCPTSTGRPAFYGALARLAGRAARPSSAGRRPHLPPRRQHGAALRASTTTMADRSPHHYYRVADLQAMVDPGARARRRGARGVRVRVRRQRPLPRRPGRRVRPLAARPRLLRRPPTPGVTAPAGPGRG